MKDKVQIERVDNFGDTRKITYNVERRQFEGVGRISSTDVARLFDKISEHYSPSKSKRGKRITELSTELSKLIKADGNFMADTYSYITAGDTILLHIDR